MSNVLEILVDGLPRSTGVGEKAYGASLCRGREQFLAKITVAVHHGMAPKKLRRRPEESGAALRRRWKFPHAHCVEKSNVSDPTRSISGQFRRGRLARYWHVRNRAIEERVQVLGVERSAQKIPRGGLGEGRQDDAFAQIDFYSLAMPTSVESKGGMPIIPGRRLESQQP